MLTDLVADLLTRIRNAQRAGHKIVAVKSSKMTERVLSVLQKEGFIESFEAKAGETLNESSFTVFLKYYSSGRPMVGSATRVSRPGKRIYVGSEKLPRVHGGLGIAIISTSQGVMSDREALRRKIGGEVIAVVG